MFSRVKNPGYGVLTPDAPDQAFLIYWLYYLFNRHVGANVAALSGTAPYIKTDADGAGPQTPVLATVSGDGKTVFVVAVNASADRAVPATCRVRGWKPGRVSALQRRQQEPD